VASDEYRSRVAQSLPPLETLRFVLGEGPHALRVSVSYVTLGCVLMDQPQVASDKVLIPANSFLAF